MKLLVSCSCKPNINLIADNLHYIDGDIKFILWSFLAFGDFNASISNIFIEQFCWLYISKSPRSNYVPQKCRQYVINLRLANPQNCFWNNGAFETAYLTTINWLLLFLLHILKRLKPELTYINIQNILILIDPLIIWLEFYPSSKVQSDDLA